MLCVFFPSLRGIAAAPACHATVPPGKIVLYNDVPQPPAADNAAEAAPSALAVLSALHAVSTADLAYTRLPTGNPIESGPATPVSTSAAAGMLPSVLTSAKAGNDAVATTADRDASKNAGSADRATMMGKLAAALHGRLASEEMQLNRLIALTDRLVI